MAHSTTSGKVAAVPIKPFPILGSPSPPSASSPSSLLSKEWVIPPRPKPGRKPASDTPPTKRKAQNRAAQRAFRERRAARVGELEEQLKQIEEEHEEETNSLRAAIERLENEVEKYRSEITRWMQKAQKLEEQLGGSALMSALQQSGSTERDQRPDDDRLLQGCGRCSPTTRCQCLDDALNAMTASTARSDDTPSANRRPHSPQIVHGAKRVKLETNDSLEIDFTHLYASKPAARKSQPEKVSRTSGAPDPCGFCQDGTPCICAEMAAEEEQQDAPGSLQRAVSQTIATTVQYTPPPSEGETTSAPVRLPDSCPGGPGTCAQCRADPNSTFFCKSLAASRRNPDAHPSRECYGIAGATGTSAQLSRPVAEPVPKLITRSTRSKTGNVSGVPSATHESEPGIPKPTITLSCADAYTTLSRHPGYEKASSEIASWMPKLRPNHVSPSGGEKSARFEGNENGVEVEGRPAMEIDAANVMAVLKEFDRRFGKK